MLVHASGIHPVLSLPIDVGFARMSHVSVAVEVLMLAEHVLAGITVDSDAGQRLYASHLVARSRVFETFQAARPIPEPPPPVAVPDYVGRFAAVLLLKTNITLEVVLGTRGKYLRLMRLRPSTSTSSLSA